MLVINRMIRALNAKAEVPRRKELKRRMENMRLKLQEELGVLLREEWVRTIVFCVWPGSDSEESTFRSLYRHSSCIST